MTEKEWLVGTVPYILLDFLPRKASDRKSRLFAVACCRRLWRLLTDECGKKATEAAELYSEGLLGEPELIATAFDAYDVYDTAFEPHPLAYNAVSELGNLSYSSPIENATSVALLAGHAFHDEESEQIIQCNFVRDIFGNPFRPVKFNPAWRNSRATDVAAAIYDERQMPSGSFDHHRLGVLADALEEAGCDNEEILGHLRGGSEHVRGCWVVDLVLAKE